MPAHTENIVRVEGDVAFVELTQGQTGMLDAADVPLLAGRKWYALWRPTQGSFIVVANGRRSMGEGGRTIYLSRLIMAAPPGLEVDHRNHDTLNNRRGNLRILDRPGNGQNLRGARRGSRTGIRGVSRWTNGTTEYWSARVTVRGHTIRRYFPFTNEGLRAAAAAAVELRRTHHIT